MPTNNSLKIAGIAAALGAAYVALVSANSGGHDTTALHGVAADASRVQMAQPELSTSKPAPAPEAETSESPQTSQPAEPPPSRTPPATAPPTATTPAPPAPASDMPSSTPGNAATPPVNPNAPAASPAAPPAGVAATNPNTPTAAAPSPAPAAAQQQATADPAAVAKSENNWPCVQVKVEKIDEVAVWDGPPVADLMDKWFSDSGVSDLVTKIISRRMTQQEAEKAIEEFAKSLPDAERDAKLAQVFAGVLSTANTQRASILGGIERFQKRQRENAKEIEKQGEEIAKLEENAPSDLTVPTPEIDKARERYDWFTRVFQERQGNIPIACELPTLIEQRVFGLARAIRARMKS